MRVSEGEMFGRIYKVNIKRSREEIKESDYSWNKEKATWSCSKGLESPRRKKNE
jgi:hypothetical protein